MLRRWAHARCDRSWDSRSAASSRSAALPAGAGAPGLIAFDRTVDGSGRVALARTSGGTDRVITPAPGNESPVWSPDGSRLLYISGAGFADSDLYVYSLGTGRSRRLTAHAGLDAFPAWSPDGRRIAWTASRGGRIAIWVMSSDGSHKRQLTHGSTAEDPSWSPDGRTIAFIAMPSGSLEIMRADGSGRRRLSTLRAAGGRGSAFVVARWHPDRDRRRGRRRVRRSSRRSPAAPADAAASVDDRMATGLVAVRTRDRVRQPGTG